MFQAVSQTYTPQQSPPPMDNMLAIPENTIMTTGPNGDQKPLKTRASCDACSRAKIIHDPRTTSYTAESSPEPTDPFFFGPATPEYNYQDAFMVNGFDNNQSPAYSDAGSPISGWSNEDQLMFGSPADMFAPLPHFAPPHSPYGGHYVPAPPAPATQPPAGDLNGASDDLPTLDAVLSTQ
ncbi:hypothetical protein BKA66DRAFT_567058 [Pyrenochaeta sp. MPI-SDFR-AT-0127]|nr:hypothetical protein BKA66DRAFT_567058 [Pyrenochaeta sp. MPI-SDFR-AT-0127]